MQPIIGTSRNLMELHFKQMVLRVRGLSRFYKVPFIWRKVVPGKRVTLPAESTSASVYMRTKMTPLPESRAGRACSDRLALTELTRLGEPKCLYGEKLARLGG